VAAVAAVLTNLVHQQAAQVVLVMWFLNTQTLEQ
jgi:hypothetical protein